MPQTSGESIEKIKSHFEYYGQSKRLRIDQNLVFNAIIYYFISIGSNYNLKIVISIIEVNSE